MSPLSNRILSTLLALELKERAEAAHRCCGSKRWAQAFAERLEEVNNDSDLFHLAADIWSSMDELDILEAFTHHPQIGADPEQLRARFKTTHTWSANEQSGMSEASDEVIERLAKGNRDYLAKFGYIFIVCATGKTAAQMLALLEARLPNLPADELKIAAAEQAKITQIRLEKL